MSEKLRVIRGDSFGDLDNDAYEFFIPDRAPVVILECDGEGLDQRVGPLDWEMVRAIDGAAFVLRDLIAEGKILLDDQGALDRAAQAIAPILKEASCPTPS